MLNMSVKKLFIIRNSFLFKIIYNKIDLNIHLLEEKYKIDLSKEEVYTGFITWTHKIKEWNTRILDKWYIYYFKYNL
jgi:hypothetical protein